MIRTSKTLGGNNGFTLVEIVIYTGMAGLILTSLVYFGLIFAGLKARSESMEETSLNANFAMHFIESNIRQAKAITNPGAGAEGNSLSMSFGNGQSMSISVEFGRIYFVRGGSDRIYITSNRSKIENLVFFSIVNDGKVIASKINFSIIPMNKDANDFRLNMQSTSFIRSSYGN
jgi:hypothetical protein